MKSHLFKVSCLLIPVLARIRKCPGQTTVLPKIICWLTRYEGRIRLYLMPIIQFPHLTPLWLPVRFLQRGPNYSTTILWWSILKPPQILYDTIQLTLVPRSIFFLIIYKWCISPPPEFREYSLCYLHGTKHCILYLITCLTAYQKLCAHEMQRSCLTFLLSLRSPMAGVW